MYWKKKTFRLTCNRLVPIFVLVIKSTDKMKETFETLACRLLTQQKTTSYAIELTHSYYKSKLESSLIDYKKLVSSYSRWSHSTLGHFRNMRNQIKYWRKMVRWTSILLNNPTGRHVEQVRKKFNIPVG
jgi:hypothetical protein